MVKRLPEQTEQQYEHVSQTPAAKRGRPRGACPPATTIGVSVALLRRAHTALAAAASDARTPSIKNQLTEAAADISERLGPALDPSWKPDPKRARHKRTTSWRVVLADGTERVTNTLAGAAALYGRPERSLAVMLSQGGGKCQRKVGDSAITCERLA